LIDTFSLSILEFETKQKSIIQISNQNFFLKKSWGDMTAEEEYNLRGIFRFGKIFMTSDKNYVITTYDVFHRWIDSNGEVNWRGTGGGGIIIVNLMGEQKIKYISQFYQY
jgi:hypothetical protein